ncbi:hypothetical protein FG167_00470 [Lacinutrix sp. WUR7]|uniref:hypothetical protein n=1 Tax=Lacinutrix sp. WUR7 TaxID=2653681 RepID=UPI00193CA9AA|nr:hypothetical protein [Lacinutrix sp. WUR7]QRM87754.1 hypothetical protein FG167_00470 [Lacinutrix sp. WUR7]
MKSVKKIGLYSEVLRELNYAFGNIFLFDGYVVSEIAEGIVFSWEMHGECITMDLASFYGTDGSDLIFISNRVNSYSVMAADWSKFFKNSYNLQSYYVVGQAKGSLINIMFEKLFFKSEIRKFTNIETAVTVAKGYNSKGIEA